jgi:hypothetical protein
MMLLIKNILTSMLALLLVNPACCCSLGGSCIPEKAPIQSCCSSFPDNQESQQNQEDNHTCMCSQNKEYPDFKALHFPATDFAFTTIPPVTLLDTGNRSCTAPLLLPASTHPPPRNDLRILYSVFRL